MRTATVTVVMTMVVKMAYVKARRKEKSKRGDLEKKANMKETRVANIRVRMARQIVKRRETRERKGTQWKKEERRMRKKRENREERRTRVKRETQEERKQGKRRVRRRIGSSLHSWDLWRSDFGVCMCVCVCVFV
jgi:hypothetical protein